MGTHYTDYFLTSHKLNELVIAGNRDDRHAAQVIQFICDHPDFYARMKPILRPPGEPEPDFRVLQRIDLQVNFGLSPVDLLMELESTAVLPEDIAQQMPVTSDALKRAMRETAERYLYQGKPPEPGVRTVKLVIGCLKHDLNPVDSSNGPLSDEWLNKNHYAKPGAWVAVAYKKSIERLPRNCRQGIYFLRDEHSLWMPPRLPNRSQDSVGDITIAKHDSGPWTPYATFFDFGLNTALLNVA